MRLAVAAAVVLLAVAPSAARAEPRRLEHDLRVDGAVAAAAVALWVGSEVAKRPLAPSRCRWCEPNALDSAVRDRLVLGYGEQAARTSDVIAMALLPAGVAAHQLLAARAEGDTGEGWVDVLLVAEAAALAMDLNQLVKFSVGRERPFVRHGNFREANRPPDPDDNVSFFSGHTTLAFSLASAAGTVSSLRGYRSEPWVWGIGMTLATAVGYLRIAADRHYLTDVLVGAVVGSAAGVALPRLLHGRKDGGGAPSGSVTAVPLGFVVVF